MMNELKDELVAAPADVWQQVPITANHHKWLLLWCRFGDDCGFCFCFVSPKNRMYSYYVNVHGIVTGAEVVVASGERTVASYDRWDDKPDRLDAVLRLTPTHIIGRLSVLLMFVLFRQYAPAGAYLLDYIKRHDDYIVIYRDDSNTCTPYVIHHLTDSGLYYGHYYADGRAAWCDFNKMR